MPRSGSSRQESRSLKVMCNVRTAQFRAPSLSNAPIRQNLSRPRRTGRTKSVRCWAPGSPSSLWRQVAGMSHLWQDRATCRHRSDGMDGPYSHIATSRWIWNTGRGPAGSDAAHSRRARASVASAASDWATAHALDRRGRDRRTGVVAVRVELRRADSHAANATALLRSGSRDPKSSVTGPWRTSARSAATAAGASASSVA
jgi:hypothetical protein